LTVCCQPGFKTPRDNLFRLARCFYSNPIACIKNDSNFHLKLHSMKTIAAFIFFIAISATAIAQTSNGTPKKAAAPIKQYYFVMLSKGPNRNHDSATAAKIQEGHMANITRLYKEGKLKVAGPFGDDGDWRGIFVFDCATKEEVEQLLKTDPAISSGRLVADIRPWWTAATGSFTPGKPKEE
jgi:uncharacterized protein